MHRAGKVRSGLSLPLLTAVLLLVWMLPFRGEAAGLLLQDRSVPLDILLKDEGGTVYVPFSFFSSLSGIRCAREEHSGVARLEYKRRVVIVAPGVHALMVNGKRLNLPAAPYEVDQELYVPLRPVARTLGLKLQVLPEHESPEPARQRLSRIGTGEGLPDNFKKKVENEKSCVPGDEYSTYAISAYAVSDNLKKKFAPSPPTEYPKGRFSCGVDAGYYKPWGGEFPRASLAWRPFWGLNVRYAFHKRLTLEERYEMWNMSVTRRHFINPQLDGTFRLEIKSTFLGLIHYFPHGSRWRFGVALGALLDWIRLSYHNDMVSLTRRDDTVGYEARVLGEYFIDETTSVTKELRYRGGRTEFTLPEVGQEFELELDSLFGGFGINYYFD